MIDPSASFVIASGLRKQTGWGAVVIIAKNVVGANGWGAGVQGGIARKRKENKTKFRLL